MCMHMCSLQECCALEPCTLVLRVWAGKLSKSQLPPVAAVVVEMIYFVLCDIPVFAAVILPCV